METTVDFRRTLLRFDSPYYPPYNKPSIPKFYSNFFGSWKPSYIYNSCIDLPPQYGLKYPIRNDEYCLGTKYSHTKIDPYKKFIPYWEYLDCILPTVLFIVILIVINKMFK